MSFQLSTKLIYMGLLGVAAPLFAQGSAPRLPADWFQLPEELDQAAILSTNTTDFAGAIGAQSKVRALFQSTQDSLDTFTARRISQGMGPQNWRATGLQLNMGIGLSGVMGSLVGKGTIATAVSWTRTRQENINGTKSINEALPKRNMTFHLSSMANPETIDRTILSAEQAVLATGRISQPATLHYNLHKHVQSAHQLISSLVGPSFGGWEATQFTLSLAIEASGMVMPALSVGGGLQVQFVFDIESSNAGNFENAPVSELEQKQRIQLQKLVAALKSEMDSVAELRVANNQFLADQIMISIGVTIGGDIGVAEVEAEFSGALTFEPRARAPLVLSRDVGQDDSSFPILLIKKAGGQQQQAYARKAGIEELAEAGPGLRASLLPRGHFQRGFKRAVKLSKFVTKAADGIFSRHWTLTSVQPSFGVSIGGDMALVSISGNASISINFTKI